VTSSQHPSPAPEAGWLNFCRAATDAVRKVLERHPRTSDRAQTTGVGKGGDTTLVIDQAAEDAVFSELECLGVALTAVSEERGEVAINGGGPVHVVIDPIDGTLNAKRHLAPYSLSIAVSDGEAMSDVAVGWIYDFARGEEWWAVRGEGTFVDGRRLALLDPEARLEFLGLEGAEPGRLVTAIDGVAACGADRLRAVGSIALSLCFVADARLDGMLSLGPTRSVDAAAGQLIVREAGGSAAFPDAGGDSLDVSLSLDMRSRIFAAPSTTLLDDLLALNWGRPGTG
jgi:myo-inositol-1(or 4)-monophosphatase